MSCTEQSSTANTSTGQGPRNRELSEAIVLNEIDCSRTWPGQGRFQGCPELRLVVPTESKVYAQPFASLLDATRAPVDRVRVQPGLGSAGDVFPAGSERRKRVEHPVHRRRRPSHEHLLPVLFDGLPRRLATVSSREDAHDNKGGIL